MKTSFQKALRACLLQEQACESVFTRSFPLGKLFMLTPLFNLCGTPTSVHPHVTYFLVISRHLLYISNKDDALTP